VDEVDEVDLEKLPALLKLYYGGIAEAVPAAGQPKQVSGIFSGFQKCLYS